MLRRLVVILGAVMALSAAVYADGMTAAPGTASGEAKD